MKGPVGFGRIINLGMSVVVASLLTFTMTGIIQSQAPELPIFTLLTILQGLVTSIAVSYILGDLIPAMNWGIVLTRVLHIKNRIGQHFIISITLGLVFGICVLFLMSFINNINSQTGFGGVFGFKAVLAFFIAFVPIIVPMAIAAILIFLIPLRRLAVAISGFNPDLAIPAAGEGTTQ
jgi:hypothetical protein